MLSSIFLSASRLIALCAATLLLAGCAGPAAGREAPQGPRLDVFAAPGVVLRGLRWSGDEAAPVLHGLIRVREPMVPGRRWVELTGEDGGKPEQAAVLARPWPGTRRYRRPRAQWFGLVLPRLQEGSRLRLRLGATPGPAGP